MKRFILTLMGFFLLFANKSMSQSVNVNINSYKLTDFIYREMGINLDLSTNNSYYYSGSNSSSNGFDNNAGVFYYASRYNRKYIGYSNFSFQTSNSISKSDNSTTSQKYRRFNFIFNYSTSNRIYFYKNYFIDLGLIFYYNPFFSNQKIESDFIKRNSTVEQSYLNINPDMRLGKGRIENVTDARLALYILNDLKKIGKLKHEVTETEVFEFADFLTKVLNKRTIDSRNKRIEEFAVVDSFLVSNKYVEQSDGLYFGYLYDNLEYARLRNWYTGSRWFIGVAPFFNDLKSWEEVDENNQITKRDIDLKAYGVSYKVDYDSRYIIGLKWLSGYNLQTSYNLYRYDTVKYNINFYDNYNTINTQATFTIAFVPNTRTYISGSTGVYGIKRLQSSLSNKLEIYSTLGTTIDYYLSEKLRFGLITLVNYNFNKVYYPRSTTNQLNFSIRAGLVYYIF